MVDDPKPVTARRVLLTVLMVAVTFWVYSFCHAPIPGSNEPHYLCKAKHFWQPDWCSRDFFLTSSNPHLVFYVVTGWLAPWLSLSSLAVLARGVGYLWLAIGWTRFCLACGLSARLTVISAWLLLVLNSYVSLSGEWLVGGIESKVIAYALVLSACADVMTRSWKLAGLHAGLAVAFHPLVGLWSVIAGAFALGAEWLHGRLTKRGAEPSASSRRAMLWGAMLFLLTAACGVVPALSAVAGASAQDTYTANFIQVFFRLSHHLDPMQFALSKYVIYCGLLVTAVCLQRRLIPTAEQRWLRYFVIGATLIAIGGWVAGVGERPHPERMPLFELRMSMLKFYPFRLADVVVPIFFVVTLVAWLRDRSCWSRRPEFSRRLLESVSAVLFLVALVSGSGVGSARNLPSHRERDGWLPASGPRRKPRPTRCS